MKNYVLVNISSHVTILCVCVCVCRQAGTKWKSPWTTIETIQVESCIGRHPIHQKHIYNIKLKSVTKTFLFTPFSLSLSFCVANENRNFGIKTHQNSIKPNKSLSFKVIVFQFCYNLLLLNECRWREFEWSHCFLPQVWKKYGIGIYK